MAAPRRTGFFVIAAVFGLAIIGGAIWLQSFRPTSKLLASTIASEPFHIAAHLVLYGSLAGLLLVASSRRRVTAIAGVAVVAFLQESAQALSGHRMLGRPELFDFCVDAVALALALFVESRTGNRATLQTTTGAR